VSGDQVQGTRRDSPGQIPEVVDLPAELFETRTAGKRNGRFAFSHLGEYPVDADVRDRPGSMPA
jgi:hypothetical protein